MTKNNLDSFCDSSVLHKFILLYFVVVSARDCDQCSQESQQPGTATAVIQQISKGKHNFLGETVCLLNNWTEQEILRTILKSQQECRVAAFVERALSFVTMIT